MKNLETDTTTKKASQKPDPELITPTPRWVKVFGVIGISLVLIVILIMLFSGGEHGPGRHLKSGASNQIPSALLAGQKA